MTLIQVVLGGITRLTGSGLSITEWNLIMGTLPPLNEVQWTEAFSKYQNIPQYQLLNSKMQLHEFKFIFFWEWFHRLWARGIGLVFLFPFVYFIVKKYISIPSRLFYQLVGLILLGGLQGAVGWIMVLSGLTENIYVAHTKLTLHLLLACILFAYIIWITLDIYYQLYPIINNDYHEFYNYKKLYISLLITVFIQLAYGGLMAGQRAALDYPTFPLMHGQWIPDNLVNDTIPLWANFIDNKTMIQFIHRLLPIIILALICYLYIGVYNKNIFPLVKQSIFTLLLLVVIQLALGIITLLFSAKGKIPWLWGALHQCFGIILFIVAVVINYHLLLRRE